METAEEWKQREQKRETFQQGADVFTCLNCGKETRGSRDSYSVRVCRWCYQEEGYENAYSDGTISKDEYEAKIKEIEEDRAKNQVGEWKMISGLFNLTFSGFVLGFALGNSIGYYRAKKRYNKE